MPRKLALFCILYPWVFSALNLQGFVSWYISLALGQLIAYVNLVILVAGLTYFIKENGTYSKTARMWVFFYLVYFFFGLISSIEFNRFEYLFRSIIPPTYFLAFFVFLRNPINRNLFLKILTFAFVLSSFFLVLFYLIGYDVDKLGTPEWGIDRAGGLFGDANNACLIAILTFILVHMNYRAKNLKHVVLRLVLLTFIFYSIFITFSTTGFFIFSIVLGLLNYKFFTKSRILLIPIVLPIFYAVIANLDVITEGVNLTRLQRVKIDNIVNLVTFNTTEVDSSGRNELLERLLEYVYENPFIGNSIGFGNSMSGHNTIIGIWADAGILALLSFLILLGVYFVKAIKSSLYTRYFSLSFLITLSIYMLSLQTVINQPYLMAIFVYLGYLLDKDELQRTNAINN